MLSSSEQSSSAVDGPIGKPLAEFRCKSSEAVAGYILSLLALVGALFVFYRSVAAVVNADYPLQVWNENEYCWVGFALCFFLGGGILLGISWLMFYVARMSLAFHLVVGENGIEERGTKEGSVLIWGQITSVLEEHLHEKMGIVKGPLNNILPKLHSKQFTLSTNEGKSIRFDNKTINDFPRLFQLVKSKLDNDRVEWVIEDVYN